MVYFEKFPALDEQMYRETLPNGLTFIVIPRTGFSKKIAYFVTDFGAIHTDFTLNGAPHTSPAGIAHYLEHKMFDMPGMDVSAQFAALGASVNAFTSYDMTAYYFSCTQNFAECLKLLLQFVSTPYFTRETVEKEQGIIGQEIGMHADSPDSQIFEDLMTAMYHNHPVHTPILGTKETIAQITPEELRLCHDAFYRPGNMLLCIVADVDPALVRDLATRYLPEKDDRVVSRPDSWDEPMTCPKKLSVRHMKVAMPMFQLGFKCEPPEKGAAAVRQEYIGELAAETLFGESSPLFLRLYEEGIIDSSFGGGFETLDGMAMLSCSGDCDQPEILKDIFIAEAQRILKEGISQEDFLRMKRSAMGRRIRDLDSFDSTAFRACAYHLSGFDYFRFPEIYQSIQINDILEFLERVVTEDRCAVSIIYPIKED